MRRFVTGFLAALLVLMAFVVLSTPGRAQVPLGSFVDELVWIERPNIDVALPQVSANEFQHYMFNLRSVQSIEAALVDPNLNTVVTPGSVDDMFLNPVPNGPGVAGFNPFQIKAVREAFHWALDRDFIVEQVFGGHAVKYITPFHPLQPEYLRDPVFYGDLSRKYDFNPALAREVIFRELGQVPGMTLGVDGKWSYQGAPLTVQLIIRTEDRRLDIGNYVGDVLEGLGITVVRNYNPAATAFAKVYFGDPSIGAWHIYTEGFGFTALPGWADGWIAGFYTDSSGDEVFLTPTYSPDAVLVDLSKKLERSAYVDYAERQAWQKRAAELAMIENTRMFLVAEQAVFITHKSVGAQGYVYDLSGGPWQYWTPRTMRYATPGGTLKIGQPVHFNSQWNHIAGFSWLYDVVQYRSLSDPGTAIQPHLGTFFPVRSPYTVQTAGYLGTPLAVPAEALDYDPATNTWRPVGAGVTAVSKVTFDFIFGKWHNGADVTMDDIWYHNAYAYRLISDFFGLIDPHTGTQFPEGDLGAADFLATISSFLRVFLQTVKGFRQVDADTYEVYIDYWHVDPNEIAAQADHWPTEPWESHELAAKSVKDNDTRFHASSARIDLGSSARALDMVRGLSLPLLQADLAALSAANAKPPDAGTPNSPYTITDAEATDRWSRFVAFSAASQVLGQTGYTGGHFMVSNGPFFLQTVDYRIATDRQSIMKRFADYPLPADKYDALLTPKVPDVSIISVGSPGALAGEIVPGLPATIAIQTRLGANPYGLVGLDYLIVNPATGDTLFGGKPTSTATGQWQVTLTQEQTSTLLPGAYEVQVIAVGQEAAVPKFASKSFVSIPQLVFFERLIRDIEADIGTVDAKAGDAADSANAALTQIVALNNLLTTVLAVTIIALIIAVVSVAWMLVRTRKPGAMMPSEPGPPT